MVNRKEMIRTEIFKVLEEFRHYAPRMPEGPSLESVLLGPLGIFDSLTYIRFLTRTEQHLGSIIDSIPSLLTADTLTKVRTVEDLVVWIDQKIMCQTVLLKNNE